MNAARLRTRSHGLEPGDTRRFLEQHRSQRAGSGSQLEPSGQPRQQPGLPPVPSAGAVDAAPDQTSFLSACRRQMLFRRRCVGRAMDIATKAHRRRLLWECT